MAKRTKISVANKSIINERAKGCCEYCKSPFDFSTELFSIEHILPISLGGDDELSNLAFACIGCNIFKSNKLEGKDPISQAMTILFNPRIMFWEEHFFGIVHILQSSVKQQSEGQR